MNRENISARLRQARIRAGYASAAEAARAMGANTQTYSAHENNNRGMSTEIVARYATFFKVPIEWLLSGKPELGQSTIPLSPEKANANEPRAKIEQAARILVSLFKNPPDVGALAWALQEFVDQYQKRGQ